MEDSNSKETKLSMKLLVDTKANKVLYAEAGKEFVDFLFHIMTLPIGTVIKLLKTSNLNMVGSLGDHYRAIQAFGTDKMQPNVTKDSILSPITASISHPNLLLLKDSSAYNEGSKKFYSCSNDKLTCGLTYNAIVASSSAPSFSPSTTSFGFSSPTSSGLGRSTPCNYVSDAKGVVCPGCNKVMAREMKYVGSKRSSSMDMASSSSGYVKGVVTYMVMDNLEVEPTSAITPFIVFNKFHVTDVSSLVGKQVEVGFDEAVAILKASLETQAVLTTVFLGKANSRRGIRIGPEYDHI